MAQKTSVPPENSSSRPRVALGISGGVDSSLCAHLLVEQGYDVTGVYMECWRAPGCRTDQDRSDALKVALSLQIPFQVLDFKQTYKDKVVELFFSEYEAGRTPNPDVLCNKEIKFGLFYDWAMTEGFDYVATGHYAKIIDPKSDFPRLAIPADEQKDQTYFLYPVTTDHLKHTLFPLQSLTKSAVRSEATKRNLHNADKKDSVGICFIGDIDVKAFLKDRLGENPGDVINTAGEVIGRHQGLWFYTIGQRHGFEIDRKSVHTLKSGEKITKENIPPFYVVAKLPQTNQLMVGFGTETTTNQFNALTWHWIGPNPFEQTSQIEDPRHFFVRIRHTGELIPVKKLIQTSQTTLSFELTKAVPGVATGQSAVLYQLVSENAATLCLGGGVIEQLSLPSNEPN